MRLIEIILTAIGLAMDCFAVSIACGVYMKKIVLWPQFKIALFFGLFQAIMPCIGWLLGAQFYDYICRFDHWIAFGILFVLGGNMIRENFKSGRSQEENKHFNPYKNSVVLTLALATSIDALAVGLSFSLLEIELWSSVSIIGLCSFLFSWTGILLAVHYGNKLKIRAELIGGMILMAIGSKILLEHLLNA